MKTLLDLAKRHVKKRYSNIYTIRLKCYFLSIKKNSLCSANTTTLITMTTLSLQQSMVVAASCYGDVFHGMGLGNWPELNGAKYKDNSRGKCVRDLRLGRSSPSAGKVNLTAKATLKWFKGELFKCLGTA